MKRGDSPALVAEKLLYLTELIAAIDRRVPHVQRAGESAIANAAVRLRRDAIRRIEEIERSVADRPSVDRRPVDA
ncbi:MAG TPA: hypothetical protein VJ691_16990 [Vicinamibacterales bacterium]|nr:hypothetical protein [Vicinamibacterales bacterium]